MNGRELAEALRGGRRVYGTLIVSTSPHWPAAVKSAGVDFVFIDTEHIAIDRATLAWMCQAYRTLDLAPIVRIPEPDPYQACMVLDGGASGVLAPYVESPEQVRQLYGAVKLRPLKGRVLADVLDGKTILPDALAAYVRENTANNVLMINVESVPAIEALDDILAVPGIDAVQVGPHDLSCSLGVAEQYWDPLFDEAVKQIITRARAKRIGVGVHFWEGIEREIEWVGLGANLVIHSGDITLFSQTLRADVQRLRQTFGDISHEASGKDVNI